MRPQILQNAQALVSPRANDVANRAVPVKEGPKKDGADSTGVQVALCPCDQRFEAVVVGGVADGALLVRQTLQAPGRLGVGQKQGFFDQDVLALLQEELQQAQFQLVWSGQNDCVVPVNRAGFGSGKIRLGVEWVGRGNTSITQKRLSLASD